MEVTKEEIEILRACIEFAVNEGIGVSRYSKDIDWVKFDLLVDKLGGINDGN